MMHPVFCLLFALFLTSCGCERREPPLRIGVDPTWTPLNFGAQTPYVNGFTDELLLEIAQESKVDFVKIPANWDTLLEGLREKKYEAVLTSLPPYSFYQAKYDFTPNFLNVGPVLIQRLEADPKRLDQIKGEEVGIIAGDATLLILQKYPEILIRTYSSIPDLLNSLDRGEIEGALLGRIPAMNYVSDLYEGHLKIVSPPLTDAGLHLIAPKGKEEKVVASFERAVKSLKKKGTLKSLLEKWSLIH